MCKGAKKGSDCVFKVGDKVIYGSEGVFAVVDFTTSPIDKCDERVFYILSPIFGSSTNKILTPAEGGNVLSRAVIDKEAALSLIDEIPEIGEVEVEKERNRREAYRNAMISGDGRDYVKIIKTVRRRRAEFIAQKRRISETDTDFEDRARKCLFGELSVALGIEPQQVSGFITERLGYSI